MTYRLITADARTTSPADFARSLGLRIRTPEQKAAEWRATCERYATSIENGFEALVPPPCLADARAIVAERAANPLRSGDLGLVDVERLGEPLSELRTGTGGFWS